MKHLLYTFSLLLMGCGQHDQQAFNRSYEEITTSEGPSVEIVRIEGTREGPFVLHSATSFRQDEVPNYWLETEKGRTEFRHEVEPLPFSKNPDFYYSFGAFLNENSDVLFVLKKHFLIEEGDEPIDADNPGNPPENSKNQLDD